VGLPNHVEYLEILRVVLFESRGNCARSGHATDEIRHGLTVIEVVVVVQGAAGQEQRPVVERLKRPCGTVEDRSQAADGTEARIEIASRTKGRRGYESRRQCRGGHDPCGDQWNKVRSLCFHERPPANRTVFTEI